MVCPVLCRGLYFQVVSRNLCRASSDARRREWARCLLDMGEWLKFQAFCYIQGYSVWVCLFYSFILHRVCMWVPCQAHWLWKNNLTGFNCPPPPTSSFPSPFLFCCVLQRLGIHLIYSELRAQARLPVREAMFLIYCN